MSKKPLDKDSEDRASITKQYDRLKSKLTRFPDNHTELPKESLCAILFSHKFPGEFLIREADMTPDMRRLKDNIPPTPTPTRNSPNSDYSKNRQKELRAYDDQLNSLTKKELLERVCSLRETIVKDIEALKSKREWWTDPQYQADFEHWSRIDNWSAEEGIILSLGLDPSKVNPEQLQAEAEYGGLPQEFTNRLEVVKSSVRSRKLDANSNEPKKVIDWLNSKRYSHPDDCKLPTERAETVGNTCKQHTNLILNQEEATNTIITKPTTKKATKHPRKPEENDLESEEKNLTQKDIDKAEIQEIGEVLRDANPNSTITDIKYHPKLKPYLDRSSTNNMQFLEKCLEQINIPKGRRGVRPQPLAVDPYED